MSERKLVGTNEMFKKALAGGYAIGAYNGNFAGNCRSS